MSEHGGGRYVKDVRGLCGMHWEAAGEQQHVLTARAVQSISCDLRMCQSWPGTTWGGLSAPCTPSIPPTWQHGSWAGYG